MVIKKAFKNVITLVYLFMFANNYYLEDIFI